MINERPRHSILIVDDMPANIKILGEGLREDHDILVATDGARALEISREQGPDLILLDIIMPGMDGLEVCRRLKQDPATREIPVIFVTSRDQAEDEIVGLDLGAVDYITKPYYMPIVKARVRAHLDLRWKTQVIETQNEELKEKQRLVAQDLQVAAGIQQSLLPRTYPEPERLRFASAFHPSAAIGGDIYDTFNLDDRYVGIYILDVAGHGISSALVTVSVSQAMHPHSGLVACRLGDMLSITDPARVMELLDAEYPIERFEKHFTMVYAILDLKEKKLTYCNAGHPSPILLGSGDRLDLLTSGGPLVGLDGELPFLQEEITLSPGDKLFFYTDGLTEYAGDNREMFGERRLVRTILDNRDLGVEALVGKVLAQVEDFAGPIKPKDDVTLLGVEIL